MDREGDGIACEPPP
ncbi:hypothetical protein [Streptomyces sp. NPDC058411]